MRHQGRGHHDPHDGLPQLLRQAPRLSSLIESLSKYVKSIDKVINKCTLNNYEHKHTGAGNTYVKSNHKVIIHT